MLLLGRGLKPQFFPGTFAEYTAKERSRTLTPEEQLREGELQLLEMRLAGLMRSEPAETERENRELMQEIFSLRQEMSELMEDI
ncbi:hypothetical protein D3C72_2312200 [compost metagenome]